MSTEKLVSAITCGNLSLARELLDEGANINTGCSEGRLPGQRRCISSSTPLCAAARNNNLESVQFLLRYGADANYQCQFSESCCQPSIPLHEAARHKDDNGIVAMLIRHNANVLAMNKASSTIALHLAVVAENRMAVYFLLDGNSEVALRQLYTCNNSGKRPRDICNSEEMKGLLDRKLSQLEEVFNMAERDSLYGVKSCLESSANRSRLVAASVTDIDTRNQIGDTAMHCACRGGALEVVKYLMGREADLLLRNDRSRIPLHYAARWNRTEVVKCLTSDVDDLTLVRQLSAQDSDGQTPATFALKFGHHSIANYLDKLVADGGATVELQTQLLEEPPQNSAKSEVGSEATLERNQRPSLAQVMPQRLEKVEANSDNVSVSEFAQKTATTTEKTLFQPE